MTLRQQDLDEETQHWRDYQRQQADAARRAGIWDHAEDRSPARTWPQVLGALAYSAVAGVLVFVILAFGFFG